MGRHTDPWAIEVIERIRECGRSLGYVTAVEEKRITRGWVDVCWIWNAAILPRPIYLLAAEVDTSKSDWPRVRSNAAKVVSLQPAIYVHIFKPGVKLTDEEREQLLAIHHGRHIIVIDDEEELQVFLSSLLSTGKEFFRGRFLAFCLIHADVGSRTYGEIERSISGIRNVLSVFPVYGFCDFVAVLSVDDIRDVQPVMDELIQKKLITQISTLLVAKQYVDTQH